MIGFHYRIAVRVRVNETQYLSSLRFFEINTLQLLPQSTSHVGLAKCQKGF